MNSLPGTIGVTYENRLARKDGTHQKGVLESKDEKCKTLMFRDAEGNSFNITSSTFKSNWRKYKGDDVIETSAQVEERHEEVEEAKKVVEKKPLKKKLTRDELFKAVNAAQKIVESIISDDYEGIKLNVTAKGGLSLRVGSRGFAEIWMKPADNVFNVCMSDEVYDEVPSYWKDENEYINKYFEARRLRRVVRGFSSDMLEQVTRETLDAIVAVTSVDEEEEE